MQNRDRGLGIFVSLFGLGVFVLSFTVKTRTVLTIGPGFMPRIIGAILLLLGVVLTLQTFRKKQTPAKNTETEKKSEEKSEKNSKVSEQRSQAEDTLKDALVSRISRNRKFPVVATFVLLILYVGLLEILGFTLATACYLALQFLVLAKERTRKRTLLYVLASLVCSAVITVIFGYFLRLYLPQGVLGILGVF